MRSVAGRQHHFDAEKATGRVHRLADMAEDREALTFVPVVDNVRKNVSICSIGNTREEIAGLNRHPIAHALRPKQSRCVLYDMRPVEQYAARRGMIGKDSRQHVTGRAANVNDGLENRKIISSGDGWRFLVMEAYHRLTE